MTPFAGDSPEDRRRKLRAAVIIPAHNNVDRLRRLLAALEKQTETSDWCVVVVDDGSDTPLREAVPARPGVIHLWQKNAGPSVARNRGARAVDAEILVFIDQDCLPRPDWLSEMLGPFSDPKVLGAKGVYRTTQTSTVANFVQVEYEEKYGVLARKPLMNFVDGYSAAFRREAFMACGGFAPDFPFPSVEDREMSLRLSQGKPVYAFCRNAVVEHTHTDSFGGYLCKKFKYGYWGFQIMLRSPSQFMADDHTPNSQRFQVIMMALLGPALASALLGLPLVLWAWLAAFALSALPLTLAASRKGLRVGLAAPLLIFIRAAALAAGLAVGAMACRGGRPALAPAQGENSDNQVVGKGVLKD
jgi:glycosyltransferase involved in cell wall biosynthesis